MGCSYRTHINTHLGPMWVLYFLLAGITYNRPKIYIFGSIVYLPKVTNYRNLPPIATAIVHVTIADQVQNAGNGYL